AAGAAAIVRAADDAADERGSEDARRRKHRLDLRLGGALRRVEDAGAGTNGEHAQLEVDAERVGVRAHIPQVIRIEAAEQTNLAIMRDAHAPAGREIELIERVPSLRAQAVHVEAEAQHGTFYGQSLRRPP